jgi:glucose-6-phosphate 1-dehydrogenase
LDVAKGVRSRVYSDGFVNRIVIEKPFGKDLDSSRELGTNIAKLFKEEEVIMLSFLSYSSKEY